MSNEQTKQPKQQKKLEQCALKIIAIAEVFKRLVEKAQQREKSSVPLTGDGIYKAIQALCQKALEQDGFNPVTETELKEHPFGNSYICINLKAASKPGYGDDDTYKEYPRLYDLLPRGAFFLVNKENGYAMFLARGLPKFTAMSRGDDDDAELAKAEVQFDMECVAIDVTAKANGENAQISLFRFYDQYFWIIGSKHSKVVLPFDYTVEDVVKCEGSLSFHVAGRVARAWLNHKKHVDGDMLNVLNGRTLQFELEDPESMHLELLKELRLVAITLIDNDSGFELDDQELFQKLAHSLDLHTVFDDVSSLKGFTLAKAVEYCRNLLGKEGYVITYEGKRYKVKTHWYVFWRAVRQRTIKLWKKGATLDSVLASMKDRLSQLGAADVLPKRLIGSRLNSVAELFIMYVYKMVFPIVENRRVFFAQYPIHLKNFFEFCDGKIGDDLKPVSKKVFQQLLKKIDDTPAPKKNCCIMVSGKQIDGASALTKQAIDESVFNGDRKIFWSSNYGLIKKAINNHFVVDLDVSLDTIQTVDNHRLQSSLKKLIGLDDVQQQVAASSSNASSSSSSSNKIVPQVVQNRKIMFFQSLPGLGKSFFMNLLANDLRTQGVTVLIIHADGVKGWFRAPVVGDDGKTNQLLLLKKPLAQHLATLPSNSVVMIDINGCGISQKIANIVKTVKKGQLQLDFFVFKNPLAFGDDAINLAVKSIMGRGDHPSLSAKDGEDKVRDVVTNFQGYYSNDAWTNPHMFHTLDRQVDGSLGFKTDMDDEVKRVVNIIVNGQPSVSHTVGTSAPVPKGKGNRKTRQAPVQHRLVVQDVNALLAALQGYNFVAKNEYHVTLAFNPKPNNLPDFVNKYKGVKEYTFTHIVNQDGFIVLVNPANHQSNGVPHHITIQVPKGKRPVDAGFKAKDPSVLQKLDQPIVLDMKYIQL